MATIKPINKAEAIFAPFFDDKLVNLNELQLIEYGADDGTFTKAFDFYNIKSKATKFILSWRGEIEIIDYDCLRFFLNFSKNVVLSAMAYIDDKEVMLFENIKAGDTPIEPTSKPLIEEGQRAKLTRVDLIFDKIDLSITETNVTISWLGLVASYREHLLEEDLPKYDAKWDGLINPKGVPGIENNVLLQKEDLEYIKKKLHTPEYANISERIAQNAKKYESYSPEEEIREYLPCTVHLYRYVRARDRGRQEWNKIVADLAIAGYLFDNKKWSQLSARIVLSIVHTPYWFEGPVFHFLGSDFHDVCFMEESYTSAVVKAMGFLGDILTPKAKELVTKKIEENWKWVDFKCSEPGYRLFMNQGVVGNYGRIAGAYYLNLTTGNFGEFVEKAYEDHTKILDNYLTEEGHCTEGPAYYQYAFSSSMYLWIIYARYKNRPIEDIVPQGFKKSAQYAEAIMSSINRYGQAIPFSNGQVGLFNQMLLMFLVLYCGYSEGNRYLKARLENNEDKSNDLSIIDILFMIHFNRQQKEFVQSQHQHFRCLKKGGLLSYNFKTKKPGKLLFLCERNPLTGHYHYDRGSFALEANGKILFPDLGTTNYSNMKVAYMKKREYHSTVYPLNDKMTVISKAGEEAAKMAGHNITEELTLDMLYTPEAKILFADETENGVHFKADLAPLYSENIVCGTREGNLFVKEESGLLQLLDEWEFVNPDSVNANFLSYGNWEVFENSAKVMIGETKVEISFAEESAEESGNELLLEVDESMTDYAERPVSILRVKTQKGKRVKLITNIEYYD